MQDDPCAIYCILKIKLNFRGVWVKESIYLESLVEACAERRNEPDPLGKFVSFHVKCS